jgi:hypothetical protein
VRLQLRMRRSFAGLVLLVSLLGAPLASAENRAHVRGVYYREHSTRVVQPMVLVTADLPLGYDVGAHALVDAVTSASVAAGANLDEIFTEYRKEGGVTVGKTIDRLRAALSYRQSREPDYVSQTGAASFTYGVWDNSGTVGLVLAYSRDSIRPLRLPRKSLDVYFGGAWWAQSLTPTTLGQIGYDVMVMDGYFANPYIKHPNLGRDKLPLTRVRHAMAARVGHYLPQTGSGLQLHYRFYIDTGGRDGTDPEGEAASLRYPWGLTSHSVEARLFQELGRDFELRLSYRYHSQGDAGFYCPGQPGIAPEQCYNEASHLWSVDVKFGALATHMPEAKVYWNLRLFRNVPLLRFFAPGTAEISYGYYFQDSKYGGAHLLQTGYSLPF